MKQWKSGLAVLAALAAAASLTACGGQEAPPQSSAAAPASPAASSSAPSSQEAAGENEAAGARITEEDMKLTWFVPLYNSNVIQSANDQYCWQEIQARTGITIEFIHPPAGSETDNFNVRVASNDLTDIVTWQWINYTGGPGKAIGDGIIVDVTPYMGEHAPNYTALIDSIPTAGPNSRLDDGTVYGFIHAVPDPIINATGGYIIRGDWLEKVGMETPVTIQDWYNVLTAFKTQDPNGNGQADEIPYVSDQGGFTNFAIAWGIRNTYFADPAQDGKIVYGPITPAYKEFLAEMAKWYAEGLIDPEFPTNARKNIDEKMTTGVAGSLNGAIGSQLGSYNLNGAKEIEGYNLIGIAGPTDANGVAYSTNNSILQGIGNQCSAVTTKNAHPVESIRLLDYLYGEEGRTLLNWGKEGESYEVVDGKPRYTDLIMNNPEGKTKLDAVASYAVPIYGYFSSFYLDSYASINLSSPQQQEAAEIWASLDTGLCMPVLFPTEEEGSILNKKGADINTYVSEMLIKYVIGKESLDNYDAYVESIQQMGIDELIGIQQAMYDRYLAKS